MTATADSSVPTEILFVDQLLFSSFPFIIDNYHIGNLLRKGIEMNNFFYFSNNLSKN